MKVGFENEKKFRVASGPVSDLVNGAEITQGYLWFWPVVRVRFKDFWDSLLTIKIKIVPGVNLELEPKISLSLARWLMKHHKYHKVRKIRYKIGRLEIDVFLGELAGLVLIEFEKKHLNETAEIPVGFVVEEVTGDERFSNHNLCQLDKIPEEWRCQDVPRSV
jgi:CYTH domain-containing protein